MNSIRKNDEAVSPVIGVILMVAVTVILAAVIAAFIFGFTGNMPKAPNVAYYKVERIANGSGSDIVISVTSPAIVDISLLSIDIDADVGTGTPLTTEQLDTLVTTGSVTVADATPQTANHVVITGSVSGLAVQELQEITV